MKFFEKFGSKLGLELNESEEIELQLIEKDIKDTPFNVPWFMTDIHKESLELKLQHTKEVYRLGRESQLMLDTVIQSNNNQLEWEIAYRRAQKADEAAHALFRSKFQEHLLGVNPPHFIFFAVVAAFSFVLFLKTSMIYGAAIATPSLLICAMNLYSKEIISLLVHPLRTQNVLDAAFIAGIELSGSMPGERLADSSSLICKLITNVNPSEELASIGAADDAPDEMRCAILQTVMTDPVASVQSPHRFERTAILNWLKIRETHPCTQRPLTADELTRDFKLKLDIACYVSDKLSLKK